MHEAGQVARVTTVDTPEGTKEIVSLNALGEELKKVIVDRKLDSGEVRHQLSLRKQDLPVDIPKFDQITPEQ